MTRWAKIACVALAALAAAFAVSASCARRRAGPPNVLVVVIDTMRGDRASLLGYGRPTTPRIDEFARGGVSWDDAWSQSSWTAPAHASLFTGMDLHHLDLFRGSRVALEGSTTIAEHLAGRGWDTATFVANPWLDRPTNLTRGFTEVRALLDETVGAKARSRELYDGALAWIRGRKATERPFFVFTNVIDPHAPYDPGPDASARLVRPEIPADAVAQARAIWSESLLKTAIAGTPYPPDVEAAISDLYDAEIGTADADLGRFLDALSSDGVLDDTLVVVLSDHGEGLGDHGWREHGMRLHRELLRVPLILRLPGVFDGGRRVPGTVRLIDVAPTILAVCGVPVPPGLDGTDLRDAAVARPCFATDRPFGPFSGLVQQRLPEYARRQLEMRRFSIYDGRHHLIVDESGATELYDVTADPREIDNLAARDPATVERLHAELRRVYGIR